MIRHGLLLFATLFSLSTLAGCGTPPPLVVPEVKGTVTLNGTALTEGTINFTSRHSGNAAIAHLGPEGKFTVAGGIVPGEYTVTITPPTPTPEDPTPKTSDIPEKYRTEETSDLTAKISGTTSDLKFELKS